MSYKDFTLDEITLNITDGTHSTVKNKPQGTCMLLSAKNIKGGNVITNEKDRKIDQKTLEKLRSRTKTELNDVLITTVGTIGEAARITEENPHYEFQRSVAILKPDIEKVDPDYFFYQIKSENFKKMAISHTSGSVQRCLFLNTIRNMKVKINDNLQEQKAIGSILSSLDDKIELNNKINKNLEVMAQALYKQWFVDFEFPNEDGAPYKSSGGEMVESELGLIPKGWRVGRIDKLTKVAIGKTPPRKEHEWFEDKKNNSNFRWYSIKDMKDVSTQIYDSSEYLTLEAVKKHNVKIIPKNTILMSFKLTIGRLAITTTDCTTNEAIAHFVNNESVVLNTYLFSYLSNFNFDSLGSTSSIATAINSKIAKSIPVIIPPMSLQRNFDQIVVKFFSKTKGLNEENINLKESRDLLLPKLMSGEIEVPIEG